MNYGKGMVVKTAEERKAAAKAWRENPANADKVKAQKERSAARAKERGYTPEQREANRLKAAAYYAKDKATGNMAKRLEQGRAWREANKEKNKEIQRRSYMKEGRLRKYAIKSRFGLTLDEWDSIYVLQDFSCAICLTMDPGKRGWATDHDHETGKTRGILCQLCNSVLGYAKDSTTVLRRAALYLEKNK